MVGEAEDIIDEEVVELELVEVQLDGKDVDEDVMLDEEVEVAEVVIAIEEEEDLLEEFEDAWVVMDEVRWLETDDVEAKVVVCGLEKDVFEAEELDDGFIAEVDWDFEVEVLSVVSFVIEPVRWTASNTSVALDILL